MPKIHSIIVGYFLPVSRTLKRLQRNNIIIGGIDMQAKYSGALTENITLKEDEKFQTIVTQRLEEVRRHFGIRDDDPGWERKLLMNLLHAHVPGFRYGALSGKKPSHDKALIVAVMEEFKVQYEAQSGKNLPVKELVQRFWDATQNEEGGEAREEHPCYGMTWEAIEKTYNQRKNHKVSGDLRDQFTARELSFVGNTVLSSDDTKKEGAYCSILRRLIIKSMT